MTYKEILIKSINDIGWFSNEEAIELSNEIERSLKENGFYIGKKISKQNNGYVIVKCRLLSTTKKSYYIHSLESGNNHYVAKSQSFISKKKKGRQDCNIHIRDWLWEKEFKDLI